MDCNRQYFLPFWTILCPFTPLTQKIEVLKKWKKKLEISSFYKSVPKIMIICFTAPEIWCMTNAIIFHFGLFFPFYPNNSSNNQNLTKNEKKTWRYHQFMQEYQKSWSYAIVLLRYACDRCNCYFSFWAIFCPFSPLTAQKV